MPALLVLQRLLGCEAWVFGEKRLEIQIFCRCWTADGIRCRPIETIISSVNTSIHSYSAHSHFQVVLRNISGFLGAMLAVAVLLNVLNRCQNRRRSNKLKKSIFTLPCYVHPSREKRAAALREARSRFGGKLWMQYMIIMPCFLFFGFMVGVFKTIVGHALAMKYGRVLRDPSGAASMVYSIART